METLPPPGEEKLVGSDASRACFSVYDPEVGWLDFVPTNNQIPMDQHITTARGRDDSDITPLKGVIFAGGGHGTTVAAVAPKISCHPRTAQPRALLVQAFPEPGPGRALNLRPGRLR